VPLSPGDKPDALILKEEYSEFLRKTHIDELRPGANLLVTAPGQYQKLLEHISVHQYFMGIEQNQEIPDAEAVENWYDNVYLPIVRLVVERNLLRDFPGRTETDLYLWIMDHRATLGGQVGWEVRPERAAQDFSNQYSPTPHKRLPRLMRKLMDIVIPDPLESGPPPGSWRQEHRSPRRGDHLFDDFLVTVPGIEAGWPAVNMAIEVARREDARLTGLHVVANEHDKDSAVVQELRGAFDRRCAEAGITARLVVECGQISDLICRRSLWMDLVVFRLSYPPPVKILQRLRSGARLLIRRCSSPLLAVPENQFHLDRALLAYGPGRKSDEALYLATYLAGRWKIPLTVLTVKPKKESAAFKAGSSTALIERAHHYLESHGVEAQYLHEEGDAARLVLVNAESINAGLLITGGYESNPLYESLYGSTVDRILRSTHRPVLICR
jgi:nucleotide-binding universal stress UspA family protein